MLTENVTGIIGEISVVVNNMLTGMGSLVGRAMSLKESES